MMTRLVYFTRTERLSEFKRELSDVRSELLSHDLEETSELGELASY